MPVSPAPEDGPSSSPTPPPEGQRKPGTWDSQAASEAARKRWEKKRAADAAAAAGTGEDAGFQPAGGSESVERLLGIVRDRQARDADVIAAARALADLQAGVGTAKPTTVAQVEALSTEGLHSLVRRLELAHSLPTDPEAHS